MSFWRKHRTGKPTVAGAPIRLHSGSDSSYSETEEDDNRDNSHFSSYSLEPLSSLPLHKSMPSTMRSSGTTNRFLTSSIRNLNSAVLMPHVASYGVLAQSRKSPHEKLPVSQGGYSTVSGTSALPLKIVRANPPTMNILVVGAPQVGKSLFINTYRAAVTGGLQWPKAPVGICGFYGTTSVEPFPDRATGSSFMLVDTPGRFYSAKDELLLGKLLRGMPWRSKLVGSNCLTSSEIEDIFPIAANETHQCVIVVPADDLVEDLGWTQTFLLQPRFAPATDADAVVLCIKGLVSLLRTLMNGEPPFVVISKMDKVGGCGNAALRQAILSLVGQCVLTNRVFFSGFTSDGTALELQKNLEVDHATRENMLNLHRDICFAVQWKERVNDL